MQPLVIQEDSSEEYVTWPTDLGYLNIGRIDRHAEEHLTLKYRLETGAAVVGRPCYLPPNPKIVGDSGLIFVASRDGFVYAVSEKDGGRVWQFSVGEPIVSPPLVIEDRVYACGQLGGMYCLTAKTGNEVWFAPCVVQFVAASKARVYAADSIGRLLVLNGDDGLVLDAICAETSPLKLPNAETDRIYLAGKDGMIQCLHEVQQRQPLLYRKEVQPAVEVKEKPAPQKQSAEKAKPAQQPAPSASRPAAPPVDEPAR